MHSLKLRLLGLWGLSLVASIAVGLLFVQLYQQSTAAQAAQARDVLARGCEMIQERHALYRAGLIPGRPADAESRSALTALVGLALDHEDGVEGGIWQDGAGPLAYAFPTYQGTGPKTDLPPAELDRIKAINGRSAREGRPAESQVATSQETMLLHACPLGGTDPAMTAWTMTRVRAAPGFRPLQLGLGVLFSLMLLMSGWLGRTLLVWGRHVRGIETVLGGAGPDEMPLVTRTGERELDRIVDALNAAGARLSDARRQSEEMSARAARAERLAALGRVAAGVAHEIRNPIAAARLQGENALAGDDARRREAIGDMLGQLDRLDALVGELLAMTQRVAPNAIPVSLKDFLAAQIERHKEMAAEREVALLARDADGEASLDAAIVGRILDNLLTNAIRHARRGGQVALAAAKDHRRLTILVEDNGGGVAPEMTDRVFEPFVTTRADGTGLGLAIARELADAHGGKLELRRAGGGTEGEGAVFALELPQESPWPGS